MVARRRSDADHAAAPSCDASGAFAGVAVTRLVRPAQLADVRLRANAPDAAPAFRAATLRPASLVEGGAVWVDAP